MAEKSRVVLPCPTCGDPMNTSEMTWILNGKIYCSESCCRKAAGL